MPSHDNSCEDSIMDTTATHSSTTAASAHVARAQGRQIRFGIGKSSLGRVLVAFGDRGICAILLGDDADLLQLELHQRFRQARLVERGDELANDIATVVAMVETPGSAFDLPLDIGGTDFQQRVWQGLRTIGAGETASYTELARRIGAPGSARAVAQACAANALAVAIPCHRVIAADGGLSGYRWGVARKLALLEREARA
jgi:AraC family transcriptional regulator of adaptative response/methylated-DNA-[protein]-cysteine methyltransferase